MNVTDVAHSCACIYRTPGKVSGTERDGAKTRGASTSETNSRLSLQSPSFVVNFVSPAQFRDQDIVNPRHPGSIVKRYRSAEPFDARINGSISKNSDSTSFLSHVVGLEAIYGEIADVDTIERMKLASNPVFKQNPKVRGFADLDRQHSGQTQFLFRPSYQIGRVDG